jgi:hypothetical protein
VTGREEENRASGGRARFPKTEKTLASQLSRQHRRERESPQASRDDALHAAIRKLNARYGPGTVGWASTLIAERPR